MPFISAGSAIAQGPNVGRIDRWSQWNPTTVEPLWFLLAGATDPPSDINISDRRTRDTPGNRSGAFLSGISRDLVNVEDAVGTKLFNTVKDLYLTKSRALEHITKLFEKCKVKGFILCCTTLVMEKLGLETGALLMGQSVFKRLLIVCL
ncbi:hypothetical protein OS493_033933 [Desmophyllum pertusum]|uniref:Uncharacterized protein n=1 Tax=Desmophyllum pertusum TaxID=174260 RepID=A0A9W9ZWB1_9CNID|nr:hypothetical protein OS493_033933 [Desmophyllum pertusum]